MTAKNQSDLVSIVIPTHNRAQLLRRAVRSALDQTGVEIEVIVVDDASTDDTRIVFEAFNDPRVRYVAHETNLGANAARNTGVRSAKGGLVAFLDSDDEWLPGKLERQVALLDDRPDIGVAYCGHIRVDDGLSTVAFEPDIDFRTGDVYADLLGGWCPHGNSLAIVRRNLLDQAGLFDTTLAGFQDYDLWLRLARISRFAAVRERLVIKHEHAGPQLTTDPTERQTALDLFIRKWETEIERLHGPKVVSQVRRKHQHPIIRAAVMAEMKAGDRPKAWLHFRALLRLCLAIPLSAKQLKSCLSLVPGLLLGYRAHESLRRFARAGASRINTEDGALV